MNYITGSQSGDKNNKQDFNFKNKNLHKPNNVSISKKSAKPNIIIIIIILILTILLQKHHVLVVVAYIRNVIIF